MTRKKKVNFVCQYGQQVIGNFNTSNTIIRSLRDPNTSGITFYFKTPVQYIAIITAVKRHFSDKKLYLLSPSLSVHVRTTIFNRF